MLANRAIKWWHLLQRSPRRLRAARIRWATYVLLITLSAGNMAGRILSVTNVDIQAIEKMRVRQAVTRHKAHWEKEGFHGKPLQEKIDRYEVEVRERVNLQRPFLSANDRSRWCTIRALVDDGTYAIDQIVTDPKEYSRWQTIDMVKHNRSGEPHLYSSKPTLLPTLLAGEYWVLRACTGWTLAKQPFQVVRTMLLCTNSDKHGSAVCVACANTGKIRPLRLGSLVGDGDRHIWYFSNHVFRGVKQPPDRGCLCDGCDLCCDGNLV